MELTIALRLIERGVKPVPSPQVWTDLGSGKGLFTRALSTLLPQKSKIYAVDKDHAALRTVQFPEKNVAIEKVSKDFVHDKLDIELCDGIIMANALHFVEKRKAFAGILQNMLKPSGHIVLIEYDTDQPNAWVPYPISFNSLIHFARETGFNEVVKLDEEPSIYGDVNMYSALLKI